MTVPGNIDALMLGGQRGYQLARSLRFNSPDSAYLNRTPASAGNRKTWTWSGWVKRSVLGTAQKLFNAHSGDENNTTEVGFNSSDQIDLSNVVSGSQGNGFYGATSAVFRDVSAWYHIIFAIDTTQSTAAAALKVYVNGVQQTLGASTYGGGANHNTWVNDSNVHRIGQTAPPNSGYFNGYLTEVNFIDGQALPPSSFGETDLITGLWGPKLYVGSYGTNGSYLRFNDNSNTTAATLGKDSSGRGNNWTPYNFSVTAGVGNDSMIDVPTSYADGGNGRGNYCTLNPLDNPNTTYASAQDGNLIANLGTGAVTFLVGTMSTEGGKYYWECTPTNVGNGLSIGITASTPYNYGSDDRIYYTFNGNKKRLYETDSAYGATYAANDVIGVAVDGINGTIQFYKNNTAQGVISYSGSQFLQFKPFVYNNSSSAGSYTHVNFGQRPFAYTPPTGFLALNTLNLPEPRIKKPSAYMDTLLYTGNGSLQQISGLGFSPDLVWTKVRNVTGNHSLYDTVRGAGQRLSSSLANAETTFANSLTSFDSTGFSLGSNADGDVNASGNSYVAWCWDKSPSAGFDIVTYTGDATYGRTVSHNLGVRPDMVIVKLRAGATEGWSVWTNSLSTVDAFRLNETSYYSNFIGAFTNFSSTTMTLGTNNSSNGTGKTYVAYLWAEVAGFSKFGRYNGNSSTNGTFVHCGFRPKWVMFKNAGQAGPWLIKDSTRGTYNVMGPEFTANTSNAETTVNRLDFLSNGFKFRAANADDNQASVSYYIFAAFAESPFKYSLAR
jgi:hypothetical protein